MRDPGPEHGRGWRQLRLPALLAIVGGVCFFAFLGRAHLFDWDECNFAEAAREMLVTGEYARVQIDFQPFWEKPPLFFWLQALAMSILGPTETAARSVNAACGVATLLLVFFVGRRLRGERFGVLWAVAFLGSVLPHAYFKSGVIDPVFNLLIFLGLDRLSTLLARGHGDTPSADPPAARATEGSTADLLAAGLFIGLATLTKGPVAVLLVALVCGAEWVRRRFAPLCTLRQLMAFGGALLGVGLAFYGTETLLRGPAFLREFLAYHLRLLTTADAGHGNPFYFHFLVVLLGCFPISLFALAALREKDDDPRRAGYSRMMLILLVVVLVVFSLVRTKIVHYSSLAYFPVTFFGARFLDGVLAGRVRWRRSLSVGVLGVGLALSAAVAVLPLLLMEKDRWLPRLTDPFARACLERPVPWSVADSWVGLGYAAMIIGGYFLLRSGRATSALAVWLGGTALFVEALAFCFVPRVEAYTQGGPVAFYESLRTQRCYLRPLFKTYAHLFYGAKAPPAHPRESDLDWLLEAPLDRPAYFVARVTQADRYRGDIRLSEIKSEYGFVYFVRRESPATGTIPAQ